MKKIINPKKNIKLWSSRINPRLCGYPFFTSVYFLCPKARPSRYYGRFDSYLHFFDHGQLNTFQPNAKMIKAGDLIIKELLSGKKEYYEIIKENFRQQRSLIKQAQRQLNQDLDGWPELSQKIERLMSESANYIYSLDSGLDRFFNNLAVINPKDHQILQSAFLPVYPSFIDESNVCLLKLFKKYPQNLKLVHQQFLKKFGWFQNSYAGRFNITESWLRDYAKILKRTKKNYHVKKISVPKKYRLLLLVARLGINYRDDKKRLLLIVVELLDRCLREFCRQNKYKYNDLRWLCYREIIQGDVTLFAKAARYEKSGRRYVLLDAQGFNDVSKEFFDWVVKLDKINTGREIRGIAASAGKITGRVKIILNLKKDSKKLQPGDILVTSMTRPEYLSLMDKASAFITNEGGLTCHAAIVARETGKPCVIAAKKATEILKDNDLVSIDANTGIITKIN